MDYSKINILNKLKEEECKKIFKNEEINTAILFGSILTENFQEYSDIDIAILSKKHIKLSTIIFIEESLQKILGRDIDIIDLKSEKVDLNIKVSVYDNGQIIYDDDNLKLYNISYRQVELSYKENETFRFFRERDVIFDE